GCYTFADWSDSSVTHPFFTMLVTLRSVAHRLQLDENRPELMRLRDVYLESWTSFESPENLRMAFRLAYKLAMVNRALSYHRVLGPLPERYKVENDAIPGWLEDFLDAEAKAEN
ncbi:MAG: aminoglycoside phosphotransferase family protein, partial [bacterium]